jgi:hypothetical protein
MPHSLNGFDRWGLTVELQRLKPAFVAFLFGTAKKPYPDTNLASNRAVN